MPDESRILTVSQFVEVINFTLYDTLGAITVEGEIGEFKTIYNNKFFSFNLKDENSVVNCFMHTWKLRTQLEDGMLVRATGVPKLRNKGFFSFDLELVTPAGEGSLKRAFELLKKKLEMEGVFALERKRIWPRFPQHVALITSRDAAAYNDFIKVLAGRMGGIEISFIHTQVQGEDAPRQILEALNVANTELKNVDVIVLVRGGGSLEDLMAFNDERVIRAVAASRTPTMVGIGHERDVTLAELAADVRASTPSNAAELLIASRQEIAADLNHAATRLTHAIKTAIQQAGGNVTGAVQALKGRITSTSHTVGRRVDSLLSLGKRLHFTVADQERQVLNMQRMLTSLSPTNTLRRGYSITRTSEGKLIRSTVGLRAGTVLATTVSDGTIESTTTAVAKKRV